MTPGEWKARVLSEEKGDYHPAHFGGRVWHRTRTSSDSKALLERENREQCGKTGKKRT